MTTGFKPGHRRYGKSKARIKSNAEKCRDWYYRSRARLMDDLVTPQVVELFNAD